MFFFKVRLEKKKKLCSWGRVCFVVSTQIPVVNKVKHDYFHVSRGERFGPKQNSIEIPQLLPDHCSPCILVNRALHHENRLSPKSRKRAVRSCGDHLVSPISPKITFYCQLSGLFPKFSPKITFYCQLFPKLSPKWLFIANFPRKQAPKRGFWCAHPLPRSPVQ